MISNLFLFFKNANYVNDYFAPYLNGQLYLILLFPFDQQRIVLFSNSIISSRDQIKQTEKSDFLHNRSMAL